MRADERADAFNSLLRLRQEWGEAYRSSGFRKTQFQKQIGERTIRSPFMAGFWQIYTYAAWLILSPFPLLLQTLPDTQTETRIKATYIG